MKKLDDRTKKLLFLAIGIVALLVVIIIVALIIGKIKNSSLTYEQIEDKMTEAAKSYYSSRNDQLPINETDEVEVNASVLVSSGYMKELSKIQSDKSIACDGKVIVTKSGEYYNYSPYLNCGDKYTTTYLYEKVMSTVVSKDDGLYKAEQYSKTGRQTIYVYRGDFVNNFVKIDDVLWRIVKVNPDFSLMLIKYQYDRDIDYNGNWDDRYNPDFPDNLGIPDYYKSLIRKELNDYYSSDVLSVNLKSKLVLKDICIGERKENDVGRDGKIECSNTLNIDYLSILSTNDYMNASLDTNCKKTIDKTCENYNYLTDYNGSFWLLNTSSNKAYKTSNGLELYWLERTGWARIVLNITKNTIYVSGDGSETNPYIIK